MTSVSWAVRKRMTGGLASRVRCLWHVAVRRYEYEICGHCGRPVGLVWSAPKSLWLSVNGQDGGVLCVPCFDARLFARGQPVAWVPIDLDRLPPYGGHPLDVIRVL